MLSIACFRPDKIVYHYTLSSELGFEQLSDWRITAEGLIVIDGQTCDVDLRGSQLALSRCLYMGAWIRLCTRIHESGKGCEGRVSVKKLIQYGLYGCWKQGPSKLGTIVFSELCFRRDQLVNRGWVGEDGHGDEGLLRWRFSPPDQLIIDDQSCRVLSGSDDKYLFLSRCLFMGIWLRQ